MKKFLLLLMLAPFANHSNPGSAKKPGFFDRARSWLRGDSDGLHSATSEMSAIKPASGDAIVAAYYNYPVRLKDGQIQFLLFRQYLDSSFEGVRSAPSGIINAHWFNQKNYGAGAMGQNVVSWEYRDRPLLLSEKGTHAWKMRFFFLYEDAAERGLDLGSTEREWFNASDIASNVYENFGHNIVRYIEDNPGLIPTLKDAYIKGEPTK